MLSTLRSTRLVALVVTLGLCSCTKLMPATKEDAAVAVAPPSATAAPAATEVSFTKKPPKARTKGETTASSKLKFTYQGKVFREENESVAAIEVQASDEFRVTKAAIEVKKLSTTKQEGTAAEKRSTNPLAGSRYIVSRSDDGKLSALDSAGSPVAPALLAELKEHFGDSLERDKTTDFLPKRPVKIGEKLIPSADAVLKLLGQKDDGSATVDGVELILHSASGDKATFNVALTLTVKIDASLRMRSKLDGTVVLRPSDALVTAVTLKGPITLLDPKGNEKGSGDLAVEGTVSFP